MMDELIKRARELAKLREKATPGPWSCHTGDITAPKCADITVGYASKAFCCSKKGTYKINPKEKDRNTALMAASWEMAELLERMATVLERLVDQDLRSAVAYRHSLDSKYWDEDRMSDVLYSVLYDFVEECCKE